jgi:SAM-dependent methyltransferase
MSTPPAIAMNSVAHAVRALSGRAREKRAVMFRRCIRLDPNTRVLDLGSEDGAHIHAVLRGTPVRPENIFIADLDAAAVARGASHFGYQPVLIDESGQLPFPDQYFDVVHCSSVIEHVTVPKSEVWKIRSGAQFRRIAAARQAQFAREIARLGRQYFVQTPNRAFPIESHSWLPLVGYLPRRALVPLLALTNRAWVKRTAPDWRLLGARELAALFADSVILRERFCGLTKSLIAVRGGGTS